MISMNSQELPGTQKWVGNCDTCAFKAEDVWAVERPWAEYEANRLHKARHKNCTGSVTMYTAVEVQRRTDEQRAGV